MAAPRVDAPRGSSQIRAWLVTEISDFLDDAQRRDFVARVSPPVRRLLETRRSSRDDWAAFDLFVDALVVADEVAGRGDLAVCWKIGRFSAQHEAGPVRSFALKVLRPAVIMSMATGLWGVHYKNTGRAKARITGPESLSVSVVDVPKPHRAHCLAVGGWIEGVLELGKRDGVRVDKTACRCDGAPSCDYQVSWHTKP